MGDVDNRVDEHGVGKPKFDHVGPDHLCDGIRAKSVFGQFLGCTRKMEVVSGKPYTVSKLIGRCYSTTGPLSILGPLSIFLVM